MPLGNSKNLRNHSALHVGEQLHVVPSLGAGHHAADGHGDDVQQIVLACLAASWDPPNC